MNNYLNYLTGESYTKERARLLEIFYRNRKRIKNRANRNGKEVKLLGPSNNLAELLKQVQDLESA